MEINLLNMQMTLPTDLPLAFFSSIGTPEIVLIFFIVLLIFGAKKLPQLARGVGRSMVEFRRAREEFEDEIGKTQESLGSASKSTLGEKEIKNTKTA